MSISPGHDGSKLLVIVPSRGRPGSVSRMVWAWRQTGAYADGARLVFAVDADDPTVDAYHSAWLPSDGDHPAVQFIVLGEWLPMVHKLNRCVTATAEIGPNWSAIAFLGDDHVPRTPGWVRAVLDACADGPAIVYGRDGLQDERLPTWWAMTTDIIKTQGRIVPADVEHLYCDNAIKDLGEASGCLRYLPGVLIEHMHPVAGKGRVDAGYSRVNSREQYDKDQESYLRWRKRGMAHDVAQVQALMNGGDD